MTIIEELDDGDDENIEEEELIEPAEERGGNHYIELKEELNKKSEAVFIVMLISFLIYKIIDFMIDWNDFIVGSDSFAQPLFET